MTRRVLAVAAVFGLAVQAFAAGPNASASDSGPAPRAGPSAAVGSRGPEIELVLPPPGVRSRPEAFLAGLASFGFVPEGSARVARGSEAPRLSARFGPDDLPLVPTAGRLLGAAGLREVTLQLYLDGDLVRLVASVRLEPRAPAPPLVNAPLAPPALGEDGWAAAAVSLDAPRLVPWALDVAARADEFQGQMLRDALVVAQWNLGIDVEKDLAGSFGGGVRALATGRGGDAAALAADLRSPEKLEEALSMLSMLTLGSAILGGPEAGLEPARFGRVEGYRVLTPWAGVEPALAVGRRRLVAWTAPGLPGGAPREVARRLAPARRDGAPRALGEVLRGDVCGAAVVNVLEAVRAARSVARLSGRDESLVPAPASLAWADGEAAVAVRVGGEGLQIWGAWVPSRSALAVPDGAVARAGADQ